MRSQTARYKKLKFHTHENVGYGDINLPAEEMHTRSIVLLFNEDTVAGRSLASNHERRKGVLLQYLGNLINNISPVFLLCDYKDIRLSEKLKDPYWNVPALYVFDNYPGGTGLSEGFMNNLSSIIAGALDLVASCPCRRGCPSCVGPADHPEPDSVNPKESVKQFIENWLNNINEE